MRVHMPYCDVLLFLLSKNIFLYLGPNFFHWVCEPEISYVEFSSMATMVLIFLTLKFLNSVSVDQQMHLGYFSEVFLSVK